MLIFVLIIPFEFSDICEPFLVWLICGELSVQDVIRNELRIACLTSASEIFVLDRRLDVSGSADPEYSLIVDLDVVSAIQVIIDSTVPFGWILTVYLLYLLSDEPILPHSFANITTQPLVIR